jgi:hypothetical protein
MADENGQPRRIDLLVQALATGETLAQAARISGVSERTIRRWRHKPMFARKVTRTRDAMIDGGAGKLADAMVQAAETLRALLKAESETVRLSAAKSIVELGCRLRETGELEARLQELERRFDDSTRPLSPQVGASRGTGPGNGFGGTPD